MGFGLLSGSRSSAAQAASRPLPCCRRWTLAFGRSLVLLAICYGPWPTGPAAGRDARQPAAGRPAAAIDSTQPHPAVCRVMVPERDGISFGSGTLVAVQGQYGLVITNWHVVRDAAGVVTVYFPGGFRSGARVIRSDRDWDLAALVIWRPPVDPVPIASRAPRKGDLLTIAGYGDGSYRAATGRCTQYVSPGVHLPFEMVEVSVEARQGDSGGPIFNQRGELAGVLFGAGDGTTSGSFAGRVGTFLASISPELAAPDSSTIARHQPAEPPEAEAALPQDQRPKWAEASDRQVELLPSPQVASVRPALPERETARPVFRQPARSDEGQPAVEPITLDWRDLIGHTPWQWTRNLLAVIGLLTVLGRLLRWMDEK